MTLNSLSTDDFWKLREASLTTLDESQWREYYVQMAPYLLHHEATVRENAVERLSMAVMRAERMSWMARNERMPDQDSVNRLSWLIDQLGRAHQEHPDVIPAFLNNLRYHGDKHPYRGPTIEWLSSLRHQPPAGVQAAVVEGTLILLGSCGVDEDKARAELLALLDSPSDYIRGCAAKMLGEAASAMETPDVELLFEAIKVKDISRPGVAGPFWSGLQYDFGGAIDVTEWMMEILENRQGSEPADMPFNGVDFYLHELCDGSLGAIERMLKGGHKSLALETATETPGIVEGMKDLLIRLGEDPDPHHAASAWEHLARYYRFLHPKAKGSTRIQSYPQWAPNINVFSIRQGTDASFRDLMVLYVEPEQVSIDGTGAWKLIDLALPVAVRGEVGKNSLAPSTAGPVRIGSRLHHECTSGAIVTFDGFPDRDAWTRLEIIGRGLQGRWDPRASQAI